MEVCVIDPRAALPELDGGWNFREGDEIVPGRVAIHLLGSSRSHDVYAAWDETILGLVAVKLPRPGKLGDHAILQALAAEAATLRALGHPSFPRCFDVRLDDDPPHLVLELVEGPRLSTLIRRQQLLGAEQVIPLALQICSAIHYLSTLGLLHLDVKPKNVIMAPPPRLIDLSIARSIDAARGTPVPFGTDRYMAPEQCGTGDAHRIGHTTDVWGLGATLYEALTGQAPFPRGDPDAAGAARFPQLSLNPEPLPRHVPDLLASVVTAALERRPEDRPTAAQIVRDLGPLAEIAPARPLLGRVRVRSW
ncbi:MAG TPA: serine/threonine-protein kinase [Actinomycetota bacterium]|nr:serine/threonine-protein kinase [Actinomycetota bacterium]